MEQIENLKQIEQELDTISFVDKGIFKKIVSAGLPIDELRTLLWRERALFEAIESFKSQITKVKKELID